MSVYTIIETPGDQPIVEMEGTFSIPELEEIIAEMEALVADEPFSDEIIREMMEDR